MDLPPPAIVQQADEYLSFYQEHASALGPRAEGVPNAIVILDDPVEIAAVQATTYEKLCSKGVSPKEALDSVRVGVVAKDRFWTLIRDPVLFPSGAKGFYNRLFWNVSLNRPHNDPTGVVILPLSEKGEVGLILCFRHTSRTFQWELPRGAVRKETPLEAAKRELQEEMGVTAHSMELLGQVHTDSGITHSLCKVYAAQEVSVQASNPEESEAIRSFRWFSVEEILDGYARGTLPDEEGNRYPFTDPLVAYAILRKQLLG